MKKAFTLSLLVATLAILSISSRASAMSEGDKIFEQALTAERAGASAERDRLLAEVLKQDPDHKLAHWYSGEMLHNGKWQKVDTIERAVSSDPRWQEYRERVEASEGTLLAHADIARWCNKQGLQLEAQWHWFNVLRHDLGNREALGGLGLRAYQGNYLTTEQIAAVETAEKQAKADFKHYTEVVKAVMREAERTDAAERADTLQKISSIHNSAAIQALVQVMFADAKNEKRILAKVGSENGEQLLRQMQLAGIAALTSMPEHEATLSLLQIGLYASDAEIRNEAARGLKGREPTSYMPLLMAGLAAPIELEVTVHTLPNGEITVYEDITERGPLSEKKHTRTSNFLTQHVNFHTQANSLAGGRGTQSTRISKVWSDQWRDMANATAQVTNSQDRIELENALRKERNARIENVLELASDKELGEDPEAWWSDWKEYNEMYTPEELPVAQTEEHYDYTRSYSHYTRSTMGLVRETSGKIKKAIEPQDMPYRSSVNNYRFPTNNYQDPRIRLWSCFVAGTPVWTQTGPIAIENIRVGDLLLSQDPHTGELNYRPVLDTTLRPPARTVKLGIDDETIVATRGHRFWLAGDGWSMAKFLKPGQSLLAAGGSRDLRVVEAGEEAEAYNLEVGQFHTYFVGKSRVLVHDNTCPEPTINTLPGIPSRARVAAQQLAIQN